MNQLACPGLGTIMAGRPVGYPQLAVMVAGFLVFLVAVLSMICRMVLPQTEVSLDNPLALIRPYGRWLILGGVLCLTAWLWALWSSFFISRDAKKLPPLIQRIPPFIRAYDHNAAEPQPK
jgi:hypothetical protein